MWWRGSASLFFRLFVCLFVPFPTGGNDPRTRRGSASCQRSRQHVNDLLGAAGGGWVGAGHGE